MLGIIITLRWHLTGMCRFTRRNFDMQDVLLRTMVQLDEYLSIDSCIWSLCLNKLFVCMGFYWASQYGVVINVLGLLQSLSLRFLKYWYYCSSVLVCWFWHNFVCRNFIQLVISGDDSGRVLKYNPATEETTVLVRNIQFPNGISLSKDGSFFVFCEGVTGRWI